MAGKVRNLGVLAGVAIVLVALLSLLASAPARAAEGCSSTSLYVAAHQDDTLLFQSPNLLQDIQSGRCVATAFLTAGDDGREQGYWGGREEGAEAAYAQMAGVANEWTSSTTTVAGHILHAATLKAKPSVSFYFFRLPDGGIEGEGSMLYGFKSLMKLWNSGQPGSTSPPEDGTIEAVDHSASYTYTGLIETLKGLMTQLEPQQVLTQNYIVALKGPDHPDHGATARFTRAASQGYTAPHRLLGYRDYETTGQAQNVFGTLLGAKSMAFYTYGQHDDGACASEPACAGSAYESWLKRQYTVATETTGVVANAGFAQTTTPSTAVTLDGSASSHAGSGSLNFAWTQVGGSTVALSGANTATPSFTTPPHPTLLSFSLTVSDKTGSSKPDTVTVRVPATDPTPTAVVGPEQQVASSAAVTLDGSESWDPNGTPLQYAWLQSGGPAVTLSGSSTAKPTFTAPVGPATLSFTLVVSNGTQTSAPVTAKVKVAGIAPSFASATTTTLTTGIAGSFKVETKGSPSAAIAQTGTLPEGLSFHDNGDGTATILGTAAASAAEPAQTVSFPLTLTATNAEGEATQEFVLKIHNPGTAPSFESGTTAGFTTGAAGSFTVMTQGAPTATVKQTAGTLPSGLSFTDQGDGTAKISGTPTVAAAAPGQTQPYSITLKAESAAGSITQTLTLNVTNPGTPAEITSGEAASFTTGAAGSFTITTTGAPTAALTRTGTLPPGLSFTDQGDGTAKITGTPTAAAAPPGESVAYPLTIEAANGVGSDTQTLTLTVTNPGTPPSFSSGSSSTFTTAVAKTFTVEAKGSPTPAIAQTGTLPEGLSFHDNGDGTATISGTAAASAAPPNSSKPYALSFEATSKAGSKTQSFSLTVSNPGSAPVFKSGATASFTTETAGSFTVETTAAPKATLTKTAGELPPGMSFADQGDGTAKVSGTPTAAAAAPGKSQNYTVTVHAANGVGSVNQTLTLTVTNPGTPAQITSLDHASFTTGVAGSFEITTTGLPKATLVRVGSLPPGMSFADQGDGTAKISGTPTSAAAPPAQSKSFPITVEADNGVGHASQTLTIEVTNPGTAPSFSSASTASFTTGASASFIVATNAAPTAALSITAGDLPPGLSFSDRGDGTAKITGTPTNAAAQPAQTQDYPVTIKAANVVGQQSQTLTIEVTNPGTGPSFSSAATASFTTGAAGSFVIATNAAPTAALSVTAGDLPPGLSFADQGDGTAKITGTPTNAAAQPAQAQDYSVTIKAQNAVGSQNQTLTIKVTNPGSAPSFSSANTASFTTGASAGFVIATSAAPTAALSITAGDLPPGLTFTDQSDGTAKVSGTPTNAAAQPAQTQSYPVTIKAQNAVSQVTQTLMIKVTNPGSAPSFSSADTASFTTGAAGSFVVSTSAAPNAALSITAGDLPPGLSFTDQGDGTAKVTGTPTNAAAQPAQTQSYPVTIKAANVVGAQNQTLTIKVTNPGSGPSFSSAATASFTTGAAGSFVVSTNAAPVAALSLVTGTLPPGLSFTDQGDGTAKISGTPTAAAAQPATTQSYPITIKAQNAVGSQNQTLTIKVTNPGSVPSFSSADTASFTTGAAGSFVVATNAAPTAALSVTAGNLPPGLAFADQGDGTAKITGTPTNAAAQPAQTQSYSVTIKAGNAVDQTTQTLTIKVTNPGSAPSFSSGETASFTTGAAGSFVVSTDAAPTAALSVTAGTLPPGLAFTDQGDGTAKITGTPTNAAAQPAQTQSYPVTIKAQNAVDQTTQNLTIKVTNPGSAAAFSSANSTSFTTGVAGTFTVATSGAPTAAITKASGQLPDGVTLTDNGDGTATLAGTPARSAAPDGESLDYAFSLQASNGVGSPANQSFTLTVVNPGDAPFITSSPATGFTTDVAGSFTVTTTGAPKPALTRTGELPPGLSFEDNGDGTATISGTPEASAAPAAGSKDYDLTIAADSKAGHSSKGLKITVANPGTAPHITSGETASFTTGVAGSFTVTSTGDPVAALDADGDLPAGLSFVDNGDGTATISGTPAASAAPAGASRDYALSIAASSGAGDDSKPLTITVQRPADPPREEQPKEEPAHEEPRQEEPKKPEEPGQGGNGGSQASNQGGTQAGATDAPPDAITLSQTQLALPIGQPSRRVVQIEAPADAKVTCAGKLPKGVRCKVNKAGDLVIEVTRTASATGTYKLTVKVALAGTTTRRTLKIKLG